MSNVPSYLVKQFVDETNDSNKSESQTHFYGTVSIQEDGIYVVVDGSTIKTPISMATDASEGDRVLVEIKNHSARIIQTIDKSNSDHVAELIKNDKSGIFKELRVAKEYVDELVAYDIISKTAEIDNISGDLSTYKKYVGEKFTGIEGNFGTLSSGVADIKTLLFGSATGTTITTEFANTVVSHIGTSQIHSGMIEDLAFDKITGFDVNTTNVTVHSEDGKSQWKDNTIQISDADRVRVQIGKDASGDYSMYVWDKTGKLMFDALGLTGSGIQREIIRNDMVAKNADIDGSKLNIESVFREMDDSTYTLTSNHLIYDGKELDLFLGTMSDTVTEQGAELSSQGTQITAIQGKIDSKIWQQDIDTATGEMNTKYSDLTQDLSSFKTTVGSTYATKSGLTEAISDIEIGGRNLIQDSFFDLTPWFGAVERNVDYKGKKCMKILHGNVYSKTSNGVGNIFPNIVFEEDIQYTLRVEWCDGGDSSVIGGMRFRLFYTDGTYKEIRNTLCEWNVGTIVSDAGKTVQKITTTYTTSKVPTYISQIKLEKGNKATDWSPAPEDTDSAITETKTIATQTADKFNWIVASGTTASNFTLTDRVASLLSTEFDIDALTTFKNSAQNGTSTVINGGAIKTNSITAQKIDIEDLQTHLARIGDASGKHVSIDSDSVDIKVGNDILASFGADTIYLGKNNYDAAIDLCNSIGGITTEKIVDITDLREMTIFSRDALTLQSKLSTSIKNETYIPEVGQSYAMIEMRTGRACVDDTPGQYENRSVIDPFINIYTVFRDRSPTTEYAGVTSRSDVCLDNKKIEISVENNIAEKTHRLTLDTEATNAVFMSDDVFKIGNNTSGKSIGVGVGENGINKGMFDFDANRWMIRSDDTDIYLGSPAGGKAYMQVSNADNTGVVNYPIIHSGSIERIKVTISGLPSGSSATCYYYSFLGICFMRLYITGKAISALTTTKVGTVPTAYAPAVRYALSVQRAQSPKSNLYIWVTEGNINVWSETAVASTDDLYASGFWYVK